MKISVKTLIIFFLTISLVLTFNSYNFSSDYPIASEEFINLTENLNKTNKKAPCDIRIMTYNLLADGIWFKGSPAYTRADGVCRIINETKPDVVGLQEAGRNWRKCIRDNTEYTFICPIETEIQDAMTCIIYNTGNLILLKSGEQALKHGKDTRLRRIIWGIFMQKNTGKVFIVINTHFNLSTQNNIIPMQQATELLEFCETIKQRYNFPLFFIGDFNARERNRITKPSSAVYENLCTKLQDTKSISKSISNGPNQSAYASSNDHIFISGTAEIKKYTILSQHNMSLLSDHYPVFIDAVI